MELDVFEEYDGLNHEQAYGFVLVVSLPLLVKSHAIQLKATDEILSLRVPSLYKLELGLPCNIA